MKRWIALAMAGLLCALCASGMAEAEMDDVFGGGESLEDAARRLKDDLDAPPYGCLSLNTMGELESVPMAAGAISSRRPSGRFLRAMWSMCWPSGRARKTDG